MIRLPYEFARRDAKHFGVFVVFGSQRWVLAEIAEQANMKIEIPFLERRAHNT
jgi:hypothetical protein